MDSLCAVRLSADGAGGIGITAVLGGGAHAAVRELLETSSGAADTSGKGRVVYGRLGPDGDEVLVRFLMAGENPFGIEAVEICAHGGNAAAEAAYEALAGVGVERVSYGRALYEACERGATYPIAAEARWLLPGAKSRTAAAILLSQEKLLPAALDKGADFKEWKRLAPAGAACARAPRALIAGLPNAGKSTLLNALSGEDRALVDEAPGTTRDLVEETVLLGDLPVRLVDSAGITDTDDPVEAAGSGLAEREIALADAVIYLVDAAAGLTPRDEANLAKVTPERTLVAASRADLADGRAIPPECELSISAAEGAGMDELKKRVFEKLFGRIDARDLVEAPAPFGVRQREILERADVKNEKRIIEAFLNLERISEYYGWQG